MKIRSKTWRRSLSKKLAQYLLLTLFCSHNRFDEDLQIPDSVLVGHLEAMVLGSVEFWRNLQLSWEFFVIGFLRNLELSWDFFKYFWEKIMPLFYIQPMLFSCSFVSVISFIYVFQTIDHDVAQLFLLTWHFKILACCNKYWNGDFI